MGEIFFLHFQGFVKPVQIEKKETEQIKFFQEGPNILRSITNSVDEESK